MTICTRCLELESKRQALDQALAEAVSCHHVGEDSACLECQACERYMVSVLERRLRDALSERDRALACEAAALGLVAEWRERVAALPPPTAADAPPSEGERCGECGGTGRAPSVWGEDTIKCKCGSGRSGWSR